MSSMGCAKQGCPSSSARFVIDRNDTIRYAQADPNYTVRPEHEDAVVFLNGVA